MKAIIAIVAVAATIVTGIAVKRANKKRNEIISESMDKVVKRAIADEHETMDEMISMYVVKHNDETKATQGCTVAITNIINMFGIEIAKRELELNGWSFNAENNTFSYRKVVVNI